LDEIPQLDLPSLELRKKSLIFSERDLVGKFIGLWPSQKFVEAWVAKKWPLKINGQTIPFSYGHGYFMFLFLNNEETYVLFIFGSYFMGFRGMYLSPWTFEFKP
jgi:hypothetical protein